MASAFRQRPEGFFARNDCEDFVVIPRPPRFLGRLDLDEVHIVDKSAVGANFAAFRKEIINPKIPHFAGDRLGLISPRGANRAQIVEHGGVHAGMAHGRHDLAPVEELLRPGTRLVVSVQ